MTVHTYVFRTFLDLQNNNLSVPYATSYCVLHNNGKWRIAYYMGCDQKPTFFIRSTSLSPIEVFQKNNVMENVQVELFNGKEHTIIKKLG